MLRREVGDEAFWKGLSTYFKRYQNGNALTDDFRGVMEEVSGKQLEKFFRQWVYMPGQPVIQGSWSYANGVLTVEIHQAQTTDVIYEAALDIEIVPESSAAPRLETVRLAQRDQSFAFKVASQPSEIHLDPNVWLLMEAGPFVKK
jgi:aminopeptidase N